jgi:hypothetical protein
VKGISADGLFSITGAISKLGCKVAVSILDDLDLMNIKVMPLLGIDLVSAQGYCPIFVIIKIFLRDKQTWSVIDKQYATIAALCLRSVSLFAYVS